MEHARHQIDWLGEHGPRLLMLARQWVNDYAAAEDVLAEAFARFWQHQDRVRDPVAYLYESVRRRAMNWKRDATRQAAALPRIPAPPLFVQPDEETEQAEQTRMLSDMLERLPQEQREILVMRTWSELSFEQIGRILEIPTRTAQSRHRTALEKLRQLMMKANAT